MKSVAEKKAITKLSKLSQVARDDDSRVIEEPGVNFARFMYAKNIYLLELFKSFENAEESHYITYCNEEISSGNISEISVVKKSLFDDLYNAYSEVITSRLYNHFGIPTTFNILVQDTVDDSLAKSLLFFDGINITENNIALLSVNCVPDKANFQKLSKYGDFRSHHFHPKEWIALINKHIDLYYSDKNASCDIVSNTKEQIKQSFLKKWLVAIPIIRSNDYSVKNEGLLITEDSISLAPALDFEYLCTVHELDDKMIKDALRYIKQEIPEDYDKIINKVKQSITPDNKEVTEIDRIVKGAIKEEDTGYLEFFSTRLKSNCQELIDYHEALFGKESDSENLSNPVM